MTNEYAIQRTDQHHPTRYYTYATTPTEAEEKFRKYWNVIAPVEVELMRANVSPPWEA